MLLLFFCLPSASRYQEKRSKPKKTLVKKKPKNSNKRKGERQKREEIVKSNSVHMCSVFLPKFSSLSKIVNIIINIKWDNGNLAESQEEVNTKSGELTAKTQTNPNSAHTHTIKMEYLKTLKLNSMLRHIAICLLIASTTIKAGMVTKQLHVVFLCCWFFLLLFWFFCSFYFIHSHRHRYELIAYNVSFHTLPQFALRRLRNAKQLPFYITALSPFLLCRSLIYERQSIFCFFLRVIQLKSIQAKWIAVYLILLANVTNTLCYVE